MLRALTRDDALVDAVLQDPLTAPLPPRMKAIALYSHKLTATPHAMREADVAALRNAGLSDLEIQDVNWICGYFNLMNRIAQGLGIETDPGTAGLPLE